MSKYCDAADFLIFYFCDQNSIEKSETKPKQDDRKVKDEKR